MFKPPFFSVLAFSILSFFKPFAKPASAPLRVASSVVRITDNGNKVCTGFIVEKELALTAAHCLTPEINADGTPASVVKFDTYFDLALLKVPDVHKDPIKFRDRPVELFEDLVGIGYGNGWSVMLMLREHVIIPSYAILPNVPVGIVVQGGYVGGMSGGPVIDSDGKVVGIVQQSNSVIGYGIGVQIIKTFLLDAGLPQ